MLIQSYVWRKKAELALAKSLPRHQDMHWSVFYLICKKKPFERNLIKNHSGEHKNIGIHWQIVKQGGDHWIVENPPIGVPELPLTEPVFEGKQSCFVTSYNLCLKIQEIDLIAEGLTPYVLDVLQPPIKVSEWYSCRWDCPAIYECQFKLLRETNIECSPLDVFEIYEDLEGEKQNKWFCASHIFKDYGPGVRKIGFIHGGKDKSFWAGHYGSKMAGACVCVMVPPVVQYNHDKSTTTPDK
ncbi:F-box only protein 2 [Harpegnathos saltator]|uniref:F-box only protein 2 n=2 Tax=Harpegnathos saltator TaxID=610380 RepID=E2BN95_HARSA|nr:F-box only protein 2 [Harpegnathos saltator]